jgi:hypothetical protein
MARPSSAVKSEAVTAADDNSVSTDEINAIENGKIFDYITGKPIAENDKERVRQRIARALFHEYGISVDDMEPDFKVKVDGSNKKIDIAIFERSSEHMPENVRRLVVCQKELKLGDRGAYKMRDHEQAAKDLDVLKAAMAACEDRKYGLWTNGLEFFFFRVERTRFDVKFKPIGDWPLSDESIGTRDVASHARLRRADPEMLRTAFRRCLSCATRTYFFVGESGRGPLDAPHPPILPLSAPRANTAVLRWPTGLSRHPRRESRSLPVTRHKVMRGHEQGIREGIGRRGRHARGTARASCRFQELHNAPGASPTSGGVTNAPSRPRVAS